MARIERDETPSSVRQLQDASKAVAGAAGTVAVDRVRAEVGAQSSRAAVELKAFAIATRASASSLREQGHTRQADMVDQFAGRADRLAAHLATASTDDFGDDARRLSREVADFARREPVLAVAGGFTIGLLIPKVLDAIGTRQPSNHTAPGDAPTTAETPTPEVEQVDPDGTSRGEDA